MEVVVAFRHAAVTVERILGPNEHHSYTKAPFFIKGDY